MRHYLSLRDDSDFSITIKISDSLSQFQKIISDLLNLETKNNITEPLLWISDKETEVKDYNLIVSPLINDIFKYKFQGKNKGKFCFFKCPSDNNTKLMHTVLIQQMFHAVSFVIHNEIIPKGGIPVHSLLLEYKGNGILLVGGSGVGKTTGYRRVQAPWKGLSDDQAFIVKKGDKYKIHPFITISECSENTLPTPRDINYSIPLKMIFFLNKSDKDKVIQIDQSKAAYEFYNAAILLIKFHYKAFNTNPELKNFRTAIFNNACNIIESVPSYRLNASLNGQFWLKIQEIIDSNA
ncbi:MAG: SynChlorMet cassette protein ScmC [Desulfobacteraceae bacterium]|nr:SynChlorMet cassette protein ScmC [Desulfobacteraceae bacterium]